MKDERWKMKDERWKMKDERWKMKDERWKMKESRFEMKGSQDWRLDLKARISKSWDKSRSVFYAHHESVRSNEGGSSHLFHKVSKHNSLIGGRDADVIKTAAQIFRCHTSTQRTPGQIAGFRVFRFWVFRIFPIFLRFEIPRHHWTTGGCMVELW